MAEGWEPSCGRPWPCCPRPWGAPPASPWTWAGPPGSSPPGNATPWPSATAAAWFLTASGRWPGVRPSICGTGWMAAPPTWRIWCCCAGRIIGRSTRAAGNSPANPTGASPPPHPIDNTDNTRATDDIPTDDDTAPPPELGREERRHPRFQGRQRAPRGHPGPVPGGIWAPRGRPPCRVGAWGPRRRPRARRVYGAHEGGHRARQVHRPDAPGPALVEGPAPTKRRRR
jgi:hypothetical protein